MNESTFNRAVQLMVHFKSVYPDDPVWQMAVAFAEMEERYTAGPRKRDTKTQRIPSFSKKGP